MNEEQRRQFYLLNEEYYYWEPDVTEESSLKFYKRMAHSFREMLLELYEAEELEAIKYDKGDKVKVDGAIQEIENITQWDEDTQSHKFVGVSGWHEIKEEGLRK